MRSAPQSFCPSLHGLALTPSFHRVLRGMLRIPEPVGCGIPDHSPLPQACQALFLAATAQRKRFTPSLTKVLQRREQKESAFLSVFQLLWSVRPDSLAGDFHFQPLMCRLAAWYLVVSVMCESRASFMALKTLISHNECAHFSFISRVCCSPAMKSCKCRHSNLHFFDSFRLEC